MFFGVWNRTRANKENIVYAIVTIVLLERVRTGWNKIGSNARKAGIAKKETDTRQDRLVMKAAFLYALPLLLPVVKYIYRSIEELSWTVQGLVVLKSTWVFFGIVALTECFLAIVIYNLLKIYIDRMNAAIGFFAKIGRDIWDGSRTAVQVGSERVVGGVRSLKLGARGVTRLLTRKSRKTIIAVPALARTAARSLPGMGKRADKLEGNVA
jgi:hypothetical protein